MYQLACANQDLIWEDLDEDVEDGDVVEGDLVENKDKEATECSKFIDDLFATNDSDFVMDETKAPDNQEHDPKFLELPDSDVLQGLLDRQNVQDCN